MIRYVDADLLKDEILSNAVRLNHPKDLCTETTIFLIDVAPTADVEEVKHGEWKKETKFIITDDPDDDGYWRTVYICSECEREEWRKEPYCHCGAKMDGGNKND